MALDLKKWLTDTMKFSAEQADAMLPNFDTPERRAELESGYVSAADRAQIEKDKTTLAASLADFESKNQRLSAEMIEWANLTATEKSQAKELQAQLEKSQVELFTARQAVERLAKQSGIDPATVLPAVPAAPVKPEVQAVDTSKFVPADQFGTLMAYQLQLPAKLMRIAQEHKRLTGEDLDPTGVIEQIQKNSARADGVTDPVAVWEQKYNIPALREQKAKEAHDAEIAAAEARGREAARTELSVPSPSVPGRHAIVFGQRKSDGTLAPRTSVLKRGQPETTINAAAAAFRSHKYRQTAH